MKFKLATAELVDQVCANHGTRALKRSSKSFEKEHPVTLLRPLISAALRHYPFYRGYDEIALSKPLALFAAGETHAIARLRDRQMMLVNVKDHVGRTILYMGDFEPRLSYAARKILRPGDCVLDIGANLGWFSIVSSAAVGDSGLVHAFEPQPYINALFRASLALNAISNVQMHEVALSTVAGMAEFHILAGNLGAGRLDEAAGERWSTIQVRTVNAGAYLDSLDLPPVRLLKIDIEGHEEQVLKSAEQFFRTRGPETIIFESAGGTSLLERPVAKLLQDYGYDLYSFARSFRRPVFVPASRADGLPTIDHLAVKKGHAGEIELVGIE